MGPDDPADGQTAKGTVFTVPIMHPHFSDDHRSTTIDEWIPFRLEHKQKTRRTTDASLMKIGGERLFLPVYEVAITQPPGFP
jgi:hypothetical protein